MDSLRKKIPNISRPITPAAERKIIPTPTIKKKEELFISRSESVQMEKHEKAFQKGLRLKKIVWLILIITLAAAAIIAAYFLIKTYSVTKKMNTDTGAQKTLAQEMREIVSPIIPISNKPLAGQENGRINILLLGAAGEHKPGGNLTDTVMVMSINTQNNKVALLSLPRDFYVQIPDSKNFTKINSLYPISIKEGKGVDLVKNAVEKITDLKLNYYIAIDFDGFQKIIDDIGGVNVTSERDIYDPTYPGPNYSYQTFSLSKGLHKLDGKTALMYVRERHDDPEGDFGRAKRQQQVIQAVKNKMFSMQTFFNPVALSNVLGTLGDNIRTDISFDDIGKFIALSKKLDLQNIENIVVDAWKPDSLLKVSHIQVGNVSAFILVPRVGNYSEIQDLAQNIFDQSQLKKRQAAIASENASIAIVNKSGSSVLTGKIKTLLNEKLGMKNVGIISSDDQEITTQTTVTDFSLGKNIFTLDELIKKIPAKLSTDQIIASDNNTDIVITLGSDIIDSYKYEEASAEDFNKAKDGDQDNIDFIQAN